MIPEVKAAWVDALLSGKYEQGEGQLRKGDAFCCLGVLCDLYAKSHPETSWIDGYFINNREELPKEVMDWSGLTNRNGALLDFPDLDYKIYLTNANDGCQGPAEHFDPFTFAEIAEVIKEQL